MAKAVYFVILFCGLVSIYGLPTNSDDDTKEGHYRFDPEMVGLLDAVPKRSFVDKSERKDTSYGKVSSTHANTNIITKSAIPRNRSVDVAKKGTSMKKSVVHAPKEHLSKRESRPKSSAHESKKHRPKRETITKRSAHESNKGRPRIKTITKRFAKESKKNPSKKGAMAKRSVYQPKKHRSSKKIITKRSVNEPNNHSIKKPERFVHKSMSKREANAMYFPMSYPQSFPEVQETPLQYLSPLYWPSSLSLPGVRKDELNLLPTSIFPVDFQPVKKNSLEIEVSNSKSTVNSKPTNVPNSDSILIPVSNSTVMRKDMLENSTSTNNSIDAALPTTNTTENLHNELKNASNYERAATNTTLSNTASNTSSSNTTFASNNTADDHTNQTRHSIAAPSNNTDNVTSSSDKSDEFPATEDGLLQMTHNILTDFHGFEENVNDVKEATVSMHGDNLNFKVNVAKGQGKEKRNKVASSKTSVNPLSVSLSKHRFEDYLVSRFMTYVCGKEC